MKYETIFSKLETNVLFLLAQRVNGGPSFYKNLPNFEIWCKGYTGPGDEIQPGHSLCLICYSHILDRYILEHGRYHIKKSNLKAFL